MTNEVLFFVLDFFFTILCLIMSKKPLISTSQSLIPFERIVEDSSPVIEGLEEEIYVTSIVLMTGCAFPVSFGFEIILLTKEGLSLL